MTNREEATHPRRRRRAPADDEADRQPPRKQEGSVPVQVDGIPPSKDIDKHPDEVYGDTEIPHRSRNFKRSHKTK